MFIIELLVNIKSKYISLDEPFTINMIHHNFYDIIKLTAQDVHPFLYYFIGRIFTYNIQNSFTQIFMLRIVSAIPYLILLIIGNIYIKKIYSNTTSKLFMFCVITMPLLVNNMYVLRMYGWATLFITIFYLLFLYAYDKKNNSNIFIFISIFALLSAYTHYYALITIVIMYLLFLLLFIIQHKNIKYLIYSIIGDIILYLPWLIILLKQTKKATKSFWSSKITFTDIIHTAIYLISPIYNRIFNIILFLFLLCLIILIVKNIIIKNIIIKNHSIIIGILTPFLLIIICSLISLLIGHSVLMIRYIAPALGIFWLSISIIINDMNKIKITKYLLIIFILIIGLTSYKENTLYVNKSSNDFNKTIKVFNELPKNSEFIYNQSATMYSSSMFLQNNKVLSLDGLNNDVSFPIYYKVFNNISENNGIQLSSKYKNIFYISIDNPNKQFISKLTKKFEQKYKMEKISTVFLEGNSANIYKISYPLSNSLN